MNYISIIVGYRNRELSRIILFLKSIADQTNKNFELIFLDYGSDCEMSKNIKTEVTKYGFNYFYHDSTGKPWSRSAALNIGAKLSKGNYLYFTDVDLIYHKDFINHLLETASPQKHIYTRVALVEKEFKDYELIFNNDNLKIPFTLSHTSGKGILFVSKDNFNAIGGYDEYYSDYGIEDNDIFFRLKEFGLIDDWTNHNKYPVYHQWHETGRNLNLFPDKWLDEMAFYSITKQKEYIRNNNTEYVTKESRTILKFIDKDITEIIVEKKGFISTKTLYYRKIWTLLNDSQTEIFRIIVPKFAIPKISIIQMAIYMFCRNLLKIVGSPFSINYFQKVEREKYFLPEEDIKWFTRKIIKETDMVKDYYIKESKDETHYYILNFRNSYK